MRTGKCNQNGFSLLEVMIAAVVVVVLVLAFMKSMVGTFLADSSSRNSSASVNLARNAMEEIVELAFDDVLALDGDTVITSEGLALRISAVQSSLHLSLVEVLVCRPVPRLSAGELHSLDLEEFRRLPCAQGSNFSLVTMKHKP